MSRAAAAISSPTFRAASINRMPAGVAVIRLWPRWKSEAPTAFSASASWWESADCER